MQPDFFESESRSQLKSLRQRKQQLQLSLEQVSQEINSFVMQSRSKQIGPNLRIAKHASGELMIYTTKPTTGKEQVEFFSLVSVDLLREAMKELGQETQYAPKTVLASDGGQTTHQPW
jgi:hypothetical protein